MAHYKELNKELVEQLQAMRICLQQQRVEIISLRAECMCEHENNVFLRKKCKDLALLHCQQYMEYLEPDSSACVFLQEQRDPTTPMQRRGAESDNVNGRQSARLTLEYRRSSSFSQTRRSFNTTSPIRKSSHAENEVVDEVDDVIETRVESSPSLLANAIPEEIEELEQSKPMEQTNTKDLCKDTCNSGVEAQEASINNNVSRSTLKDQRVFRNITNTSCRKNSLTAQETKKTCLGKRTNTSDSEMENSSENYSLDFGYSAGRRTNKVTIGRGKSNGERNWRLESSPKDIAKKNQSEYESVPTKSALVGLEDSNDNTLEECNAEESIQAARQMTTDKPKIVELFDSPNVDASVSSYALSEITLSQFQNATSSTPRQLEIDIPSTSPPRHSSRPKRSCRPMSMVEPSIRSKMRNTSGEKSLDRKRSVSKKV